MCTGKYGSCNSLISIVNNQTEFNPWQRQRFFSSPSQSDWLWIPPSLLSSRYHGSFPQGYISRDTKLTIHLHFEQRLRMYEAILPLPPTSTWHGIKLSIKLNLPFATSSFLQKWNQNLQLYLQRTGSIESGKLAVGVCGVSA